METLLVSTSIVALAEMGDKTQIATVALAARYASLVAVVSTSRGARARSSRPEPGEAPASS